MPRRAATAALLLVAALASGCGGDKKNTVSQTTTSIGSTTTTSVPDTTATTGPADTTGGTGTTAPVRCPASPTPHPDGEVPALAAIQMVSPTKGWIAGRDGVFATTDGASWSLQFAWSESLTSIDFVSSTVGWAVGRTTLIGTTDGRCWKALGEPSGGLALRTVHFASTTVGWGIAAPSDQADQGVLVRSSDGGRTWAKVQAAPVGAESTCFFDTSNGAVGAGGGIFVTHDGGATFTQTLTADEPEVDRFEVRCGKGVFWATETGEGAAGTVAHRVLRSVDGSSWEPLLARFIGSENSPVPQSPTSQPGPASVVSKDLLQFVGNTPPAAPDNSVIATAVTPTGTSSGNAVKGMVQALDTSWLSDQQGWIVGTSEGNGGLLVTTTNGGGTWKAVAVPT